jgi:hypothetical protein
MNAHGYFAAAEAVRLTFLWRASMAKQQIIGLKWAPPLFSLCCYAVASRGVRAFTFNPFTFNPTVGIHLNQRPQGKFAWTVVIRLKPAVLHRLHQAVTMPVKNRQGFFKTAWIPH